MPVWIYLVFVVCACATSPCPKQFRIVRSDGVTKLIKTSCINKESISKSSTAYLSKTVIRQARSRFSFRTNTLRVIKAADGSMGRECPDPVLFPVYIRSIPGVRGSTVVRALPAINYGSERCAGRFIRRIGGRTSDNVPARRLSLSGYGVVAVERDSALTIPFQILTAIAVRGIRNMVVNRVERGRFSSNLSVIISRITRAINSVNTNRRPFSDPVGNDLVGINALILVHGLRSGRQPPACFRQSFPICVGGRTLTKGLTVGGRRNANVWRAGISVTAL